MDLAAPPAGVLTLRVRQRWAQEIYANFNRGGEGSLEGSLRRRTFKDEKLQREAMTWGRVADLLVDEMGEEPFLRLRATEVLMRRVAALVTADTAGNWDTAQMMEETSASGVPSVLLERAIRLARGRRLMQGGADREE
jgi:hypothetical protein